MMFLEAGASKCVNGIGTGGKLLLNDNGILFHSNDKVVTTIKWTSINSTKCYKTLGVNPNGFSLVLENGDVHAFVVDSRLIWQEAIEGQLLKIKANQMHPDLG